MQIKDQRSLQIIKKLHDAGFTAVYAGGCVRDLILKNELKRNWHPFTTNFEDKLQPHDYDIATNATPDQIEALFENTIAVGKAFGVIVVVIDSQEYEVATFRSDGNYTDGRRPDIVTFCSMEEDARRRDLTINGMFYDPIFDQIYDFVDGRLDIKNKIIRLIGDPNQRLKEDKLRMMRVVRFAVRFNYAIHPLTISAVKARADEIIYVSVERIAEEFLKTLRCGNFNRSLELLLDTGLLKHFLPEVVALKGCEQPEEFHPEGDCWRHTIKALENLPADASDELLLGTLFHDIGKPETFSIEDRIRFNGHDIKGKHITERIMKRLKFSNEKIEDVCSLVENHMKFMFCKNMRLSRLKRFLNLPNFDNHLLVHKADCLSSHGNLENYEFCLAKMNEYEPEEIRPPKMINGNDLIQMGFKQGRIFKTILEDVEDQQLENIISSREQALEYVKSKYDPSLN